MSYKQPTVGNSTAQADGNGNDYIGLAPVKPLPNLNGTQNSTDSAVNSAIAYNSLEGFSVQEHGCRDSSSRVIKLTLENRSTTDILSVPFGGATNTRAQGRGRFLTENGILPMYFGATTSIAFFEVGVGVPPAPPVFSDGTVGNALIWFLNDRFASKTMLASSIQVVGASGTKTIDEAQKAQPLIVVDYPLNIFETRAQRMPFIPQNKEFTGVELVDPGNPIVLGNFKGVVYQLLPLSKVHINITISAVDMPTLLAGS